MIYLDNAATTRPCAEAVAAVNDALTARWGNPSAVHRLGIDAARLLRAARQDVAEAMGATADYAQKYRRRLIDGGVIKSAGRGKVAFDVPFLAEHLRRRNE